MTPEDLLLISQRGGRSSLELSSWLLTPDEEQDSSEFFRYFPESFWMFLVFSWFIVTTVTSASSSLLESITSPGSSIFKSLIIYVSELTVRRPDWFSKSEKSEKVSNPDFSNFFFFIESAVKVVGYFLNSCIFLVQIRTQIRTTSSKAFAKNFLKM